MTFEEWWEHEFIGPGSAVGFDKSFALDVWNAAYIEGQKAMRERAAEHSFDEWHELNNGHECAESIRALPIEGE